MKISVLSILLISYAIATSVLANNAEIKLKNAQSGLNILFENSQTISDYNSISIAINSIFSDSIVLSLIKMKNEEKLAHDVYIALYKKWGSMPFSNISSAEERHLNAVIALLKNYGSADTLIGDVGKFTSPEVQKLYNDLIIKGSASVEQAYRVGAWIEDLDIHDLTDCITRISNPDIKQVFENLRRGSHNHLRAFNRQLTSLGVVYTPEYISQSEFDQIVSLGTEQGQSCKNQNNKKCCGKGKCKGFGQK